MVQKLAKSVTGTLAFLMATAVVGPAAHATLADDVVGALYSMKSVYSTEYAPASWKKQYASYDLNTEFNKATMAVTNNPKFSVRDSRTVFKNFIYAMKDYHTSISFVATEAASLPILFHAAEGRVFLVYVDRTKLTQAAFPFEAGDELISFNGTPAFAELQAVQAQIPPNVPTTDQALAEYRLTKRTAASGLDVPHGPVSLEFRRQGAAPSAANSFVQLIWDYTPERIADRGDLFNVQLPNLVQRSSMYHPKMSVLVSSDFKTETPYDLGGRKAFTPDLGTKTWESAEDSAFYAYIFTSPEGKSIGYLRLPSYEPDDAVSAVAEFGSVMQRFQTSTDSMVIDQVNNPGGSVFYLYALASMLTDQPLKTPLHRMSITQANVVESLATLTSLRDVKTDADAQKVMPPESLEGYPSSYEFAKFSESYSQFIIDQWNAGQKITDPYWIAGVDHINPNPIHYTKPILLVINHLDFSGGDFFPTIMQDNKRVTVFGSRTAGAGGYVADVQVPNNVGIASFRVTESIAERVSGNPIENLGVTPDIAYDITASDLASGYVGYVKALLGAVKAITP